MMKRAECEKAIRSLCHRWSKAVDLSAVELAHPSFSAFKAWLREKSYSHYLDFRSVQGAEADAEMWFTEEFKQKWRN